MSSELGFVADGFTIKLSLLLYRAFVWNPDNRLGEPYENYAQPHNTRLEFQSGSNSIASFLSAHSSTWAHATSHVAPYDRQISTIITSKSLLLK